MWSLVTSRGQRVALKSLPCVLGSDREAADVALPHSSISPAHARVEQQGDGLLISAIDGAALELDGQAVEQASLAHGDTLIIGRVTLRVADDQARATAPKRGAATGAGNQDAGDELQLRGAAAGAGAGVGSGAGARAGAGAARTPAGGARKPGAASRAAAQPERRRGRQPLSFNSKPVKRGLLHIDLSQISATAKVLLSVALLLLAAGLAWGLSELVALG